MLLELVADQNELDVSTGISIIGDKFQPKGIVIYDVSFLRKKKLRFFSCSIAHNHHRTHNDKENKLSSYSDGGIILLT